MHRSVWLVLVFQALRGREAASERPGMDLPRAGKTYLTGFFFS